MSKTFKALQRAARERAAKKRKDAAQDSVGAEERDARPEEILPLDGGKECVENVAPVESPEPESDASSPSETPAETPAPDLSAHEPEPTSSDAGTESPRGEYDPDLHNLLKESFVGGVSLVRVEPDGWVRGHIEPELIRALLTKYALLHCLRKDDSNSFWFWASTKDAQERAQRCGLALDTEGLPEP